MTTNGICTIARAKETGNYIVWQGKCMWQEVRAAEVKKYGEARADKAAVFIPDTDAAVSEGDMIIFGEYDADKTVTDGLTVMGITVRRFGSPDMQHTEIGAR